MSLVVLTQPTEVQNQSARPPVYEEAPAAAPMPRSEHETKSMSSPLRPEPSRQVVDVQVGSLAFEVEEMDGEWLASDPQTGMYGEGDDPVDAAVTLLRSLATLYNDLSERRQQLSPELLADLAYLEQHLWR